MLVSEKEYRCDKGVNMDNNNPTDKKKVESTMFYPLQKSFNQPIEYNPIEVHSFIQAKDHKGV